MERNYTQEITRCPNCNATCLVGHDDDGQVFCAKCGHSFMPKSTKELSDAEYKQLEAKATCKHSRGGWYALTVD